MPGELIRHYDREVEMRGEGVGEELRVRQVDAVTFGEEEDDAFGLMFGMERLFWDGRC